LTVTATILLSKNLRRFTGGGGSEGDSGAKEGGKKNQKRGMIHRGSLVEKVPGKVSLPTVQATEGNVKKGCPEKKRTSILRNRPPPREASQEAGKRG